jgi:16S rRNA (adenine1518-N6/adenine1519-N6)-dimethyltransferase
MIRQVRAKKQLGQHFLKDDNVAFNIVKGITLAPECGKVLEIGPGMGVLTKYLLQQKGYETSVVEIDKESVHYLQQKYPELDGRIIEGDFLQLDLENLFDGKFVVIGNFPYNISSQILFKVLDNKEKVPQVVGMFQKEVAERVASAPGRKAYGIISVFLQAYYNIEYLFTVDEYQFDPPPKVKSAVIRLTRNAVSRLDCDEKLFKEVVKAGFNQRRKTLRNALKSYFPGSDIQYDFFPKRAEELSVGDFVKLTNLIQSLSVDKP